MGYPLSENREGLKYPTVALSLKYVALCLSVVSVVMVGNSRTARSGVGELDLTTAEVFPYLLSRHCLYPCITVKTEESDYHLQPLTLRNDIAATSIRRA